MEGNSGTLNNGLTVSLDWLSFTITEIASLDSVLRLLGYSQKDFDPMPHGGKGYRSMMRLNGHSISVLYDGLEGMGIHVDVSGSAISELIRSFRETLKTDTPFGAGYDIDFNSTYLCELLRRIRQYGHITRLDLAVDDLGCRYFSIDDIVSFWKDGLIVSKFRRMKNMEESETRNRKTGHTVYFGSRESEIFLRIYDKRLEQEKKAEKKEVMPDPLPWVRWELECKGSRANQITELILSGMDLGEICIGVLGNYVRIVTPSSTNRSRCLPDTLWLAFLDGLKGLKLYIPDVEKSMDEKKLWVKKQVMPTLAAIVLSDGGSLEFIEDNIHMGYKRMKKSLLDMVRKENPAFDF